MGRVTLKTVKLERAKLYSSIKGKEELVNSVIEGKTNCEIISVINLFIRGFAVGRKVVNSINHNNLP